MIDVRWGESDGIERGGTVGFVLVCLEFKSRCTTGRSVRDLNLQSLVIGGLFPSMEWMLLGLSVFYRKVEQRAERKVRDMGRRIEVTGSGELIARSW